MAAFNRSEKKVDKKLPSLASGLYYTYIKPIEKKNCAEKRNPGIIYGYGVIH
jgi:hypothetical protein